MRLNPSWLLIGCLPWLGSCSDSCSKCGDPQPSSSTVSSGGEQTSAEESASAHGTSASDTNTAANPPASESMPTGGATTSEDPTAANSSSPVQATTESSATTDDAASNGSTSAGETSSSAPPPTTEDTTSDSSSRLRAVPVGTTDLELGFWEYLPPNYGDGPVPLLVFTHGASWQGAGTEETLQKVLEVGPPNLISTDKWPNSRPFLVLAPQNPHSGCFTSADIDALYSYALANYEIDTKRIYHTGQSCGAIGGWNYLAEHLDEHVAAAVLISGDGRDAFASAGCDLGKVAIWGLHNEKDGSVTSEGTISPINDLMNCSPKPDVKLTIYPEETAHDAWTKTYDLSAGNDIYSWLLEHEHP